MKCRYSLIKKLRLRIKKRKDNAFVLKDFNDFIRNYDYDQVLRALRTLVKEKTLVKIGQGIYAKNKTLSNGAVILCAGIGELAAEALHKLGIKTAPSQFMKDYNNGKSTQLPTGRVIAVNKRVRRKISYNGYYVEFENI